MGRRKTGVNKVRDIIRYGHAGELSERQIARALGVSRTVVSRTLQAFRASGLAYAEVEQIADSLLVKSLEQGKVEQSDTRHKEVAARFPEMVVELKKKGVEIWSIVVDGKSRALLRASVFRGVSEYLPLRDRSL